jgi:hypothetical protein
MSNYGPGNWFTKLFRSVLLLAKNYIALVVADFASYTLHDWGSGKFFKESVLQNLRWSARSLGEWLKSQQSGKGLKRARNTLSIISLNPIRKRKPSTRKIKQNCLIEKGFLFLEMAYIPYKEYYPSVHWSLNIFNAEDIHVSVKHS